MDVIERAWREWPAVAAEEMERALLAEMDEDDAMAAIQIMRKFTVPASTYRGAVSFIERIANHPSGTTRMGEAMRERAREWLAEHHPEGGR